MTTILNDYYDYMSEQYLPTTATRTISILQKYKKYLYHIPRRKYALQYALSISVHYLLVLFLQF